jgi:hypothetical protein
MPHGKLWGSLGNLRGLWVSALPLGECPALWDEQSHSVCLPSQGREVWMPPGPRQWHQALMAANEERTACKECLGTSKESYPFLRSCGMHEGLGEIGLILDDGMAQTH